MSREIAELILLEQEIEHPGKIENQAVRKMKVIRKTIDIQIMIPGFLLVYPEHEQ